GAEAGAGPRRQPRGWGGAAGLARAGALLGGVLAQRAPRGAPAHQPALRDAVAHRRPGHAAPPRRGAPDGVLAPATGSHEAAAVSLGPFSAVRVDYEGEGLSEEGCPAAPWSLLQDWIAAAVARQQERGDVPEP